MIAQAAAHRAQQRRCFAPSSTRSADSSSSPAAAASSSSSPASRSWRRCRPRAAAEAAVAAAAQQPGSSGASARGVSVQVVSTSFSSRKLHASVDIAAPLAVVWGALTDYDNLGTFIPSLVENRCLERRPHGCLLYQVGAQDVALGIKFSAACTLEIVEYPTGMPDSLCSASSDMERYFPRPASAGSSGGSTSTSSGASSGSGASSSTDGGAAAPASGAPLTRDITFALVEGDFQAFKGVWRLQQAGPDPGSMALSYSLFVRPHPWLPVKLIESRIAREVVTNLKAVRHHSERLHRRSQALAAAGSAGAGSDLSSSDSYVTPSGTSEPDEA